MCKRHKLILGYPDPQCRACRVLYYTGLEYSHEVHNKEGFYWNVYRGNVEARYRRQEIQERTNNHG